MLDNLTPALRELPFGIYLVKIKLAQILNKILKLSENSFPQIMWHVEVLEGKYTGVRYCKFNLPIQIHKSFKENEREYLFKISQLKVGILEIGSSGASLKFELNSKINKLEGSNAEKIKKDKVFIVKQNSITSTNAFKRKLFLRQQNFTDNTINSLEKNMKSWNLNE